MEHNIDRDRKIEKHILRFICVIVSIRMFVELYFDYIRDVSINVWSMDLTLLGLMVIFFVLTYKTENDRILPYPFTIIAIVLMTISWVNQGGLYGRSEYNFIALIVVISIIHSGRSLLFFVMLSLLIVISLVAFWELDSSMFELYIWDFTDLPLHYLGVVSLVTLVILYLRYKNDEEEKLLSERQVALSIKVQQLDVENENLTSKQNEYKKINKKLMHDIQQRREHLESQNQSLKEFLHLSLKEFNPPLQKTLKSIKNVRIEYGANDSADMLIISSDKLEKAYESLKEKAKSNLDYK